MAADPLGSVGVVPALTVVVYGQPAPQGSKRHVGGGVMVESSKALAPWREAVKQAALAARQETLKGPLALHVTFTLRKPASAPKRRRTWADRQPDLSKLVRGVEDALTDAGVWEDDARVVSLVANKTFPNESHGALDSPGCIIRIWRFGDAPAMA